MSHLQALDNGSSPHTRGTQGVAAIASFVDRLIPAHAGNSILDCHPPRDPAAHPRTRGELEGPGGVGCEGAGSSPHTRGTRPCLIKLDCKGRLIPAHAGNSVDRGKHTVRSAAHPRTRGELWKSDTYGISPSGSSPHTRGTRVPRPPLPPSGRLIPAHAGNSGCT